MREVLRGSLGRSLRTLPDEDRVAAAWAVACGPVLARRAEVLGFDDDRVLHVRVLEAAWREQFAQMRTTLTEDLRRIAGVRRDMWRRAGPGRLEPRTGAHGVSRCRPRRQRAPPPDSSDSDRDQ